MLIRLGASHNSRNDGYSLSGASGGALARSCALRSRDGSAEPGERLTSAARVPRAQRAVFRTRPVPGRAVVF